MPERQGALLEALPRRAIVCLTLAGSVLLASCAGGTPTEQAVPQDAAAATDPGPTVLTESGPQPDRQEACRANIQPDDMATQQAICLGSYALADSLVSHKPGKNHPAKEGSTSNINGKQYVRGRTITVTPDLQPANAMITAEYETDATGDQPDFSKLQGVTVFDRGSGKAIIATEHTGIAVNDQDAYFPWSMQAHIPGFEFGTVDKNQARRTMYDSLCGQEFFHDKYPCKEGRPPEHKPVAAATIDEAFAKIQELMR